MAETPELSDILLAALREDRLELHTCMPATVTEYDEGTSKATVLPAFKRVNEGTDEVTALPTIAGVPVVFPGTARGTLKLGLAKGDTVLLVFAERSLEAWLKKGGQQDPEDTRLHALSDAIAIPWGYKSTGDDILTLIGSLIGVLASLTVVDPISGPLILSPAVALQLEGIKAQFEAMQ